MSVRIALLLLASSLVACTPRVELATDEPIVVEIRVSVAHEVRVRLDQEVAALASSEKERAEVSGRSLSELPPWVAAARELLSAKAAGRIGETSRGYVAAVPGHSVTNVVERVNQRRRAEYGKLATKHLAPQSDVEVIAGARRLRQVAPGEMYQDPLGTWRRRP